MSQFQFDFYNHTPRKGVHRQANQLLDSIMNEAPSDASIRAFVSKLDNEFLFVITIHSSQGVFSAQRNIRCKKNQYRSRKWPLEILQSMHLGLQMQFDLWRYERFAA